MLRTGFIGCGGIAGAHVPGWQETRAAESAEVVALCDVSGDNVAKLAGSLGGESATRYDDWRRMMDAEKLDAVDICLPHHLHAPAILDAAARGVNVLCEKPLCMTLDEAAAVKSAVEGGGITLMCAHNQLFGSAVRRTRQAIDEGALGEVQMVSSRDCFRTARTREEWDWRADLKTAGGGVLIDTGYHPTYRLLHLAGAAPVSVTAMTHNYQTPIEGEDVAHVLVRFANRALGEILTSWAFPLEVGAWQVAVFGSQGAAFGRGNEFLLKPYQGETVSEQLENVNGFAEEVKHFVDCLATGARPIQTHDDGIDVLKLILGAYEAERTGRTVEF